MNFATEQLERIAPLWNRMLTHRFLLETRDGTIPFDTFARWMRQDYLFVEAAIPFIGALIPKAPPEHWPTHSGVIAMLQKELELFRERATAAGVDMGGIEPTFINHAYIQFLMATAYRNSYAEVFTVLYTAEKAYHDSWSVVKRGIGRDSVWYPFVENWAGDAFARYVAHLEAELDELAAAAGDAERARMAELFETTTRYEIAFWEMAVTDEDWPGIAGTETAPSTHAAPAPQPSAGARATPGTHAIRGEHAAPAGGAR
jgi:thiaminase/transcriptional activator TenA